MNDFIIGNNTKADAVEKETVKPQTNDLVNNFGWPTVGQNIASPTQVIEKSIVNMIKKDVVKAVMAFKN